MKALILENPGNFSFQEIERKQENDKIEIKVKSIGICGSELSAYKGTFPLGDFPRSLGHEIGGEVVFVPDSVQGISVGDKVALDPYRYCGDCYPCDQGKTNACDHLKVIGVHQNGAHSEYFSHDVHLVHKVPANMPWEHIALIETLTISMHGVNRARVKAGEFVVVTGAGAIGLLAAQYVNYLGAKAIIVDPLEKRLELAKKVGITYCINPQTCNAVEQIKEITGGLMAHAGVECSGAKPAIRSMIDYIANTGRFSLVGYPGEEVPLPTFLITKKELDVLGSRNSVCDFPLAIKLLAEGIIHVTELITNTIEFEEIPEYFTKILKNPNDYIKVIAKL